MSLRTRLALFIAFSVAAALLLQGVSGYLSFRQQAYASLDRDLGLYLTQLQTSRRRERGPRGGPRDAELLNEIFEGYVASARLVSAGQVLAQPEDFPEEVPAGLGARPRTYGVWRVASAAVSAPGSDDAPDLTIQAAISSRGLNEGLRRYRRTLLFTVLSVSLLGALASLLLEPPRAAPLAAPLEYSPTGGRLG